MISALCVIGSLSAQDLHFSQFFNSPLNTNPANTGIFNGDVRFGGHFRQQWKSVPVDYLTFSGYIDSKFRRKKNPDGNFFSGGLLFNYDRAGDARLTLAEAAGSVSYTLKFNPKNLLTLGVQLGGGNTAVDFNQDLQWDNQFIAGAFDPSASSGEPQEKLSQTMFNVGAGVNYRWQKSERTKFDLGVGAFHLNTPGETFVNTSTDLPMRISANFGSNWQLGQKIDLGLHFLGQFQDKYKEFVPAGFLSFYLNQKRGKMFRLDLGAIARFTQDEFDAIAPHVAIDINNLYLGFSWDVNMSDFTAATDRVGGPEVAIRYIIKRVDPVKNFKNCPIY